MQTTIINLEWKDGRRPTCPRPFTTANLWKVARLAKRYASEIHIEREGRILWTLTEAERELLCTFGPRIPLAREIVAEIGGAT
ncbi:hypothetical protein D3C80_1569970 [compost metagenome]